MAGYATIVPAFVWGELPAKDRGKQFLWSLKNDLRDFTEFLYLLTQANPCIFGCS